MIFLEGGRVVDPATRVDGVRTVILDGGRIKEVREQGVSSGERSAHEVVDCRGLLILPGLVDLHVHLREPGEEGKETIASGARAAVAGRRFDFTLLRAMTGYDEAELLGCIKESIAAQLVVEESAEPSPFLS